MKTILFLLFLLFCFGQKKFVHDWSATVRSNYKNTEVALQYANRIPWLEFQSNVGINNKTEFIWEAKFNLYYETNNWRFNLSPTPFNFSSKWIPDPESRIYRRYQRIPTDILIQRRLSKNFQIGIFYRLFDYPMIELRYNF